MAHPPPLATTTLILIMFLANLSLSLGSIHESSSLGSFHECLIQQQESSNLATDTIYSPNNASYPSLLTAPNLRSPFTFAQKPLLIFTPVYEHEIRGAIHCSKKLGLQIRIRSGGHDYEGLSHTSHDNPFVVVDMRNLRTVDIDTKNRTAWVQVGATLGQLYYTLARKSSTLAFPAGTCPTVGVGGHFSGGGYGMMSRRHAIAADNIVDAKLMDVQGQILDRAAMGEDLFWAIRGGGAASFGVVLAYKVRLVTIPETVTVFNITRTSEQDAERLVHQWQFVAHKADQNLVLRVYLRSVRSPSTGNRTMIAIFRVLFLGGVRDLLPLMEEQFPELGVVEQDCTEMSWIDSTLFFAGLRNMSRDILLSRTAYFPDGITFFKGKSDYVKKPIPIRGLRGIRRFLHEEDANMAELQFSPYGGVLSGFSESDTPFPHRSGNMFSIHYRVHWMAQGDAETKRHVDWIRKLYKYMTPYVSNSPREAYLNYRDLDLGTNINQRTGNYVEPSFHQASAWGRKYYKNNFEKLVRIKTEVDPTNFFRNEQSVPPLLPPA